MGNQLFGRTVITTAVSEVNETNVVSVLTKALPIHQKNRAEIEYLWNYYKGRQPILNRIKEIRPEINNMVVENRANEIVAFKTSYLIGEPIQYISKGDNRNDEAINQLNAFTFSEEKISKDRELADWFHICGTSYRMVLPDTPDDEDEAPFEIYTLDPRDTFVVYYRGADLKPVLGVTILEDENNNKHYFCYTKHMMFEIVDKDIISKKPHILRNVPIIEYPLNNARIGAFEIVIPLLDAINLVDSNRLDGIEQFIQALLLIHNVKLETEQIKNLHDYGAIEFTDIGNDLKGEIEYLTSSLNQSETQTLKDDMYQTVLTICGMPNRNGGSSTSDTGTAVILRDGHSSAESRAKDTELIFKKSERIFLKIVLRICNIFIGLEIKPSQIDIKFLRGNYENLLQKIECLTMMLNCEKIHPRLAFEACSIFPDADYAYAISDKYYQEQQAKAQKQEGEALERSNDNPGDEKENRESSQTGVQNKTSN